MTRDDAFDVALIHAGSGMPMGPRLYQRVREALGQLTEAEETVLRGYRLASEARRPTGEFGETEATAAQDSVNSASPEPVTPLATKPRKLASGSEDK